VPEIWFIRPLPAARHAGGLGSAGVCGHGPQAGLARVSRTDERPPAARPFGFPRRRCRPGPVEASRRDFREPHAPPAGEGPRPPLIDDADAIQLQRSPQLV